MQELLLFHVSGKLCGPLLQLLHDSKSFPKKVPKLDGIALGHLASAHDLADSLQQTHVEQVHCPVKIGVEAASDAKVHLLTAQLVLRHWGHWMVFVGRVRTGREPTTIK